MTATPDLSPIARTKRKFQPRAVPTLLTLFMMAILVALGVWQVQRLQWKTALLAEIDRHMAEKPVPMPEMLGPQADWEYRRVSLAGSFDYAHEFLIQPRTLDGKPGYHMVVPFKRLSGGTVLVNRGWVSDEFMKSVQRPRGILHIEGILQYPEKNVFTPESNPAKNQWYWIDISAMAKLLKLELPPAVVTIAEKKPGVYPVGGKLRVEIPNDHKQYAIFWFTMSMVLAFIWFLSQWRVVPAAGEK